jgi:hypothetical protein
MCLLCLDAILVCSCRLDGRGVGNMWRCIVQGGALSVHRRGGRELWPSIVVVIVIVTRVHSRRWGRLGRGSCLLLGSVQQSALLEDAFAQS